MIGGKRLAWLLMILAGTVSFSQGADPRRQDDKPKLSRRSPFSVEFEVYAGGITGDSIGAAFHSATRGTYGGRFTVGVWKRLSLGLDYMYSNQSRTYEATTPAAGPLPSGFLLMRAKNLNVIAGNGEIAIVERPHAKFYISPGMGLARNGSRDMTFTTPLGTVSTPIPGGRAVTFNLGAGVKIYPWNHVGLRFDLRDYVSGGGTGNLSASGGACVAMFPPPPGCAVNNAQSFFGTIPVQNNFVATLGLIFRIR